MAANYQQIRVHPGIGLARLGNSDEFFIGPEAPGVVVNPGGEGGPGPGGGTYRDCQNRLKRQAQRFRLYATDADGNVSEITSATPGVKEIIWRVHVRNLKAANYAFQGAYLFNPTEFRNSNIQGDKSTPEERDKLIIDGKVHTISPSTPQPVVMSGDIFNDVEDSELPGYLRFENMEQKCVTEHVDLPPVKVSYKGANDIELGQLRLDEQQRLIFVPAPGKAECVTNPKIELSNPSECYDQPNGPKLKDKREEALVNQFAYFNVPGWWDDTCGGEIDATVIFEDNSVISTRNGVTQPGDEGTRNDLNGGWVVTAPPKFAPHMYHVVSLLDRVYEAFPDSDPNKGKPTNFFRDVYPILSKACNYGWVSAEAGGVDPSTRNMAHGPKQGGNLLSPANLERFTDTSEAGAPARRQIFNIMRQAERSERSGPIPKLVDTLPLNPPPHAADLPPRKAGVGPVSRGNQMPKLWGTGGKPLQNQQLGNNLPNEYLSLTDWQLARMQDWANGDFEPGTLEQPKQLDDYPVSEQPHALDASALEPTIGGGFHPGIEFPYLIVYKEFFADAFRVKNTVRPGELAAYMSSPWQGDYWSCNTAWWPVQRPDIVFEYNELTNTRTYREWFRGFDANGNPLSSSDGYDQMVYAWPKLGMVLPTVDPATGGFVTSNGQPVFQEFERDPALNYPPVKEKYVKLSDAVPEQTSPPGLPFVFGEFVTELFILPNWVQIKLAGNSDGTAPIRVDDEVTIMMKTEYGEWQTIYQHDFSNNNSGVITAVPPVELTCQLKDFMGHTVKVKTVYTDLYPDSESASEFWLSFSPE